MTSHDLAILAEGLTEFARKNGTPPSGWPDVLDIDIAEYVDKAFDGCLVDDLDPPNYLASIGDAALQRKHALTCITNALMSRYRRPLNGRDLALISMAVVSVWEQKAEEARAQRVAS